MAWVNLGDLGGGGGEGFPLTLYLVPNCTSLSAVILLLILILHIFCIQRILKEVCSPGRSGEHPGVLEHGNSENQTETTKGGKANQSEVILNTLNQKINF